MIDFIKLTNSEIQDLQNIVSKNVEKSELERHYLFTNEPDEKAIIYVWCYRFLYAVHNLTKESTLKIELQRELEINKDTYDQIQHYIHKIKIHNFNKHRTLNKLRLLILNNTNIDDLIDSFAILLEKTNVLSMSRLKGIVLEGDSEKEFKRLFDKDVNQIRESNIDFSQIENNENIDLESNPENLESNPEEQPIIDLNIENIAIPNKDELYGDIEKPEIEYDKEDLISEEEKARLENEMEKEIENEHKYNKKEKIFKKPESEFRPPVF